MYLPFFASGNPKHTHSFQGPMFIDNTCAEPGFLLTDVPDDLITASSYELAYDHKPPRARLYTQREYTNGVYHISAWVSAVNNQDQYIQVSRRGCLLAKNKKNSENSALLSPLPLSVRSSVRLISVHLKRILQIRKNFLS